MSERVRCGGSGRRSRGRNRGAVPGAPRLESLSFRSHRLRCRTLRRDPAARDQPAPARARSVRRVSCARARWNPREWSPFGADRLRSRTTCAIPTGRAGTWTATVSTAMLCRQAVAAGAVSLRALPRGCRRKGRRHGGVWAKSARASWWTPRGATDCASGRTPSARQKTACSPLSCAWPIPVARRPTCAPTWRVPRPGGGTPPRCRRARPSRCSSPIAACMRARASCSKSNSRQASLTRSRLLGAEAVSTRTVYAASSCRRPDRGRSVARRGR